MEEWRKIPGFEEYEVSSEGCVRGGRWGHSKTPSTDKDGYLLIGLYNADKKQKTVRVHRLVALAFIPNPENKPEIDHIDRNKSNNLIHNLRWVDDSEQAINRNNFIGKSGQRNIHKNNCGYIVRIRRHRQTIFSKHFKTLPEAIKARDDFLRNAQDLLPLIQQSYL